MAFSAVLDPILNPILALPPLWAIVLISLFIAIFMTLVYKWMTNQTLMKSMKEDIKRYQKEMKELKSQPDKMMAVQKKAMEINMKYMMQSMKPTLITFIPIILIFTWLNGHLAFEPIMPGSEFNISAEFREGISGQASIVAPENFIVVNNETLDISNSKVEWMLKAPTKLKDDMGDLYTIELSRGEDIVVKNVLVTFKQRYEKPVKVVKGTSFATITVNNNPIKPLNLFGWRVGWLGTYIICSIVFSMSLRKLLKLY